MAMPKIILKKVRVNSASYETHAIFLTDYGRELRDFNKAQGTTLSNQLEYFKYLAECYGEKISIIKNISHCLDPKGSEDFNALLGELENREPMILNS